MVSEGNCVRNKKLNMKVTTETDGAEFCLNKLQVINQSNMIY